jgi:hypothetical protein
LCSDNNVLTENYGIIQTKNYPTFINELNCSIQFSSTQKQLIRIYAISIDLELLAASQELVLNFKNYNYKLRKKFIFSIDVISIGFK